MNMLNTVEGIDEEVKSFTFAGVNQAEHRLLALGYLLVETTSGRDGQRNPLWASAAATILESLAGDPFQAIRVQKNKLRNHLSRFADNPSSAPYLIAKEMRLILS